MRPIAAVHAAAVAALCLAAPGAAQKSPEKIRLTARSHDGAVLIRVPVQPFGYALQFSKNGSSGFMSRVYVMGVKEGEPGYRYISRTLAPGRYRLDWMWQQGHWTACLEKGTFEFEVVPGRIRYLGTLRADQLLESIQARAVGEGKTAMAGAAYDVSHAAFEAPPLEDRDESGLQSARAFADSTMHGSAGLVELADVRKTAFGTSGLGKAIKVCG